MMTIRGRCLCGQVKWNSPGPILWAGICHCESCRRANSAPMVGFFGVPRDTLGFEGQTRVYTSSDGVERGGCAKCGSAVFYRNAIWPEECHLMAASLDDPEVFVPAAHFHWDEKLPWVSVDDALPKYPGSADTTDPIS